MTHKKGSQQKKTPQQKKQKIEKSLQNMEQELTQTKEKYLRTCADLQNLQKRIDKELKYTEQQIKIKYISELINITDLLQKALQDEKPQNALQLILTNIENFLKNEQVTKIPSLGTQFDHNKHHALSTVQNPKHKDGEIINELKTGFMIEDQVIRPSQVIVVKNNQPNKQEGKIKHG